MKLTDEQITELRFAYERAMCISRESGYRREFEAVLAVYEEMIAASDTHRIVEVRDGFHFLQGSQGSGSISDNANGWWMNYAFAIRPIPAPCPPPKLDPVPINVESVYGKIPEIPEAYKDWQVEFGEACKLLDQGFTHCLYLGVPDSVGALDRVGSGIYRICFRKWGGK